jgi:hypothetical protein
MRSTSIHAALLAVQEEATPAPSAAFDAIEWEELPSLTGQLSKRLVSLGMRPTLDRVLARGFDAPRPLEATWADTMPAALVPLYPESASEERIEGLITREVTEPDVFHHFFGPGAGR